MKDYTWVFGAGSLALAAATFWAGWIARILKGETAAREIVGLKAEVARLTGDLASFKVSVAQTYASHQTIREMEERVTDAINRLGDRLDRILEPRNRTRG